MTGLTGQTIAGCEIISELGHGGMGAVYKARQSSLNRLVAVKVMARDLADDADFVTRFKREAAVAAQLHHQNMVLVHSAGEENGLCYIVMEFVEGRSLHDHITRHGRLAAREALAITIHIAQALQYAWNKSKLIHRDIKPANIFLSNEGEVKVGDLGLAKNVGQSTAGLTQTGTAMGSPLYIAPEQARGIKEVDFRADIYSLGCTLYHMLTGQPPYSGTDAVSIIHKHIFDPPPAIFKVWPQCPMPLGMLVGKMLVKQPNARHQSYEDLIADLYAVTEKLVAVGEQATVALPQSPADVAATVPSPALAKTPLRSQPKAVTPAPATPVVKKKSPAMIYGIAGAAVALLVAGLLIWSPWNKPPSQDSTTPALQHSAALKLLGNVFTNSVGAEMVYIPPGEFMLGSTKEEQAWALANGMKEAAEKREGEAPRKTAIKQGFWMGRTEVTVGQWKQFVTATGYKTEAEKKGYVDGMARKGQLGNQVEGLSWRDPGYGAVPQDNHPVCCVTWNDAVAFCGWLTERERMAGRLPASHVIRLPTEVEWEYACRAGTQTKFWWGETKEDGKDRLNWSKKDDGYEFVAPVDSFGQRGRNRFGLADMLGNVAEWCLDKYDANQANGESYKGNPDATTMLRGGGFFSDPGSCLCATRTSSRRSFAVSTRGFRVVVGIDISGATMSTASTSPAAAPKEGGILAPAETRVSALTTTPKVGEVFTLPLGSNVTMELMGIPPGEFMLGSTQEEQAWAVANGALEVSVKAEGQAPRKTSVKQGLWMGRTEVTVGQWKQFVAATRYVTDAEKLGESQVQRQYGGKWGLKKGVDWRNPDLGFESRDDHPVVCISWNDAMAFCEWLNGREQQAGRLPRDWQVRLPAEFEWEYACRAGAETKFWWGDSLEDGKGRLNAAGEEDGFPVIAPVDSWGARGRNRFGLADMIGNMAEWCLDGFHGGGAQERVWQAKTERRVQRGGSFSLPLSRIRCAGRPSDPPSKTSQGSGFRVVVGVGVSGARSSPTPAPPAAAVGDGGILAPAEKRVAALTTTPKVGEVFTLPLGSNVTMELMGIPPGEFMLGSTQEEQAWAIQNGCSELYAKWEGETPRKTAINQGFWMGRTEVTVGQWKQFVAATRYVTDAEKQGESTVMQTEGRSSSKKGVNWRNPDIGIETRDDHPVACISWNDAVAFCEWLTGQEQQAGRLPKGWLLRLPAEVEWEYACRAGAETKFWWGDSPEDSKGRLNGFGDEDGFQLVARVDSYGARGRNRFGLADMLGNMAEWCLDDFDGKSARERALKPRTEKRIRRGGSFSQALSRSRCASRLSGSISENSQGMGFRVVAGMDLFGAGTSAASTAPAATTGGVDEVFVREVAALPAEQQVARVVAKLKELNPGFDPANVTQNIQAGLVQVFNLSDPSVVDISPVAALTKLTNFSCSGLKARKQVPLSDLTPLRGLGLDTLVLNSTHVRDLSPVRSMPLKKLFVGITDIDDLTALQGLKLEVLECGTTRVTDLSPLKGMPLYHLRIDHLRVTDISVLRGMPLSLLNCGGTPIADLSPLRGMPLKELVCEFVAARDTAILRSIKTLETINHLPAAEFWKRVEAGK